MRSALQGWTWALRGLGAQSTAAAGSASLPPPPPDEDDDSTKSSRFIALEGILLLLQVVSKKDLTHGEVPFPEELRRVSLAMYLYIYVSSSSPLAASCRSVQD